MPEATPLYAEFATDLRQARLERTLTIPELARLAGCSEKNIRNLEGGRQRPHPPTVALLATALNVTSEHLTRSLVRPKLDQVFSEPELRRLAKLLAPMIAEELDRLR